MHRRSGVVRPLDPCVLNSRVCRTGKMSSPSTGVMVASVRPKIFDSRSSRSSLLTEAKSPRWDAVKVATRQAPGTLATAVFSSLTMVRVVVVNEPCACPK